MNGKDWVLYFDTNYVARFEEAYSMNWGRDGRILLDLCIAHGEEKLKQAINYFLTELDDPFVTANGHSVPLLKSAYPKIQAKLRVAQAEKGNTVHPQLEALKQAALKRNSN